MRRPIRGPFSAVQQARAEVAAAETTTELADAQYRLERALDRLERISRNNSTLSRLGAVAATSRFNAGGFSPLLGRSLSALGLSGEAVGAFSVTAAAATASAHALKSLTQAAVEGGRALKEVRDASTITGGSLQQSSRLRAFGITAGEITALRERLSHDVNAQIAGASIGVRAVPQPFGSQNNARLATQTLEGLRGIGNPEERLRRATALGVQSWLPLLSMSDKARDSLLKTADALGELERSMGPSAGADFDAAARRWELAGERLKGSLFQLVGPGMTDMTNRASDLIERWASANSTKLDMNDNARRWSEQLLAEMDPKRRGKGAEPGKNPQVRATEANTRALEKNAELIQAGLRGGGTRATNVVPAMLNGQAMQHMSQNGTLRWGFF